MGKVVVDASLALHWVLPDEKEVQVDALLNRWATSLTQMLVPPLFLSEITNALYLSVKRHRINLEEARLSLATIMQVGVAVTEPTGLYSRSLDLAAEYELTNAYDAQYIALAEKEGCELWTADERLFKSAKPLPSWLRLI